MAYNLKRGNKSVAFKQLGSSPYSQTTKKGDDDGVTVSLGTGIKNHIETPDNRSDKVGEYKRFVEPAKINTGSVANVSVKAKKELFNKRLNTSSGKQNIGFSAVGGAGVTSSKIGPDRGFQELKSFASGSHDQINENTIEERKFKPSNLITDKEKGVIGSLKNKNFGSTDLQTNIGGKLSYSSKGRKSGHKFTVEGGGNLQTKGKHVGIDKSAGITEGTEKFKSFNPNQPVHGATRTVHNMQRGGEKVLTSGTGYSYGDPLSEYTQNKNTGLNLYKEKKAKTTFKPYLSLSGRQEFNLGSRGKGGKLSLKADYGTKFAPERGFKLGTGYKKGRLGADLSHNFGTGNTMASLNYTFGGKKKKR